MADVDNTAREWNAILSVLLLKGVYMSADDVERRLVGLASVRF